MKTLNKLLSRFALWLYIHSEEGSEEMMALLFANRVILGKTEFDAVPAKLKKQVARVLIDECGLPELVPSEFGGTADTETAE